MKKGTSSVFRDDVEREEARLRAERYIRRLETDFKRQANEFEPLYYDRLVNQVKLSGDKYKPKHTRVNQREEKAQINKNLGKVLTELKTTRPSLAPVPVPVETVRPVKELTSTPSFPRIKTEPVEEYSF
jgi:hypothetical protein